MPELLTVEQVAAQLQVHPRTVRRAITAAPPLPRLRAVQVGAGSTWRIRPVDLEAWLEARANAAPGPRGVPVQARKGVRVGARPGRRSGGVTGLLVVPGGKAEKFKGQPKLGATEQIERARAERREAAG